MLPDYNPYTFIMAEAFNECIGSVIENQTLCDEDIAKLEEIVEAYPWFMTARVLYNTATGGYDPLAELHYSVYQRPLRSLENISLDDLKEPAARKNTEPELSEKNMIDKFLQKGEYRIVPDASTPDSDEAVGSSDFDLSDDFVSEELAEIYLAQGLNQQAKKIYERLSLLNPEKSIYFAEIIEGIDAKIPHGKRL